MTLRTQAVIWLAILAAIFMTLYILSPILLPFVLAFFLAYIANPLVHWMSRLGFGRSVASGIVVVLATLLLVAVLLILVPVLVAQVTEFARTLPTQYESVRMALEDVAQRVLGESFGELRMALEKSAAEAVSNQGNALVQAALAVISQGLAFVNFLSLVLLTPVLTFYLLADWDRLVSWTYNILPREHADTIKRLMREIDDVMGGFLRGQGTVVLLLGVIYAVGLVSVGLKYGLLIGLVAGLFSYIPYVGTIFGFLVGLFAAISQFWPDYIPIAIVVAVFAFGQLLENNFLSPKIVGDRIRLHPVWLIFSLFAFGYLFGVVGLLIAVPVAAMVGVVSRFAVQEYFKSALYHGRPSGADANSEPEFGQRSVEESAVSGSQTVAGADAR